VTKRSLQFLGLSALVTALAFSCSAPPGPADCPVICQTLAACQFLPSVLGPVPNSSASDDGSAGVADSGTALAECDRRCGLSSPDLAYQKIHTCWTEADPDFIPANAACSDLGQCLHGQFPTTPITGSANLRLRAGGYVSTPSTALTIDGGSDQAITCDADAGAQAATARAFVESWGVRQYDDPRVCHAGMIAEFTGVPAAEQVPVGFQLVAPTGSCAEYGTQVQVLAGDDDQLIQIDLSAPPTSACRLEVGDGGPMAASTVVSGGNQAGATP
jgi:hypothetical protein